jgi:hypothetical protein
LKHGVFKDDSVPLNTSSAASSATDGALASDGSLFPVVPPSLGVAMLAASWPVPAVLFPLLPPVELPLSFPAVAPEEPLAVAPEEPVAEASPPAPAPDWAPAPELPAPQPRASPKARPSDETKKRKLQVYTGNGTA